MDINHWGDSGIYYCNNASIAYSTDGTNFTKMDNISWSGGGKFVMFGLVQDGRAVPADPANYYMLATPAGRWGSAYLLKVPRDSVLDQAAYRYYTGNDASGDPEWSTDPGAAKEVIPAPVGELSAMWDQYLQCYVMATIDTYTATIVLRTAPEPWGPWSGKIGVATFAQYPGLYDAYMNPAFVENQGQLVYFTMSRWWPIYNVFVMAANLTSLA
jgi:hypothetical protein